MSCEDLADNVRVYRHTFTSECGKMWKSATNTDDISNNDVKLYIMSVIML